MRVDLLHMYFDLFTCVSMRLFTIIHTGGSGGVIDPLWRDSRHKEIYHATKWRDGCFPKKHGTGYQHLTHGPHTNTRGDRGIGGGPGPGPGP